jgi:hypothetical protein
MNRKLSQSGTVILVAAAMMTLASFLPFWDSRPSGGLDFTAWASDFILYPVTIVPVVCGLVMALHVVVSTFTTATLPRRILGITWNQVHLILGLQAAVMMLAFLVQEHGVFQFQLGVGFYLMLLAGIGLAIGALLRERELPLR